jgi:aspartyl-tRNA(Asn)/glutamyl-tRNA(Gln) amidotransferase subunit B
MSDYEPVIGLEVHVQLLTETKMFCRCLNRFGAEPNTLICPVCLGYPGTLPVINRHAVDLAAKLAMALGCEIHGSSVFARKNYFYPDLPKGYQISQYDRPLAERGELPLTHHAKSVHIERLHLEEDAGKLLHEAPGGFALPGQSLVDFNRCGVPLVEIVSHPDMASAAEAQDYLQTLHQLLLYTETSDGNMEEGSLRCDANVSVRRRGETRLGTKAEIKNLNSFRNVGRAIEHELARQIEILAGGGQVAQETRSFDADSGTTRTLRSKEEAHDYRYFPEPDLPPLVLAAERLAALRAALPELPWERRARFQSSYELSLADALVLCQSRDLGDYYEAVLESAGSAGSAGSVGLPGSSGAAGPSGPAAEPARTPSPKAVANWVMTEVLRERSLQKANRQPLDRILAPARLGELVAMVEAGKLSHSAAKEVFAAIRGSDEEPAAAMARLGLAQVTDLTQIEGWIDEVIEEHGGPVAQFRAGKTQTLGFLVGQAMKRSGGRAEPKTVQRLMRQALERQPVPGPAGK